MAIQIRYVQSFKQLSQNYMANIDHLDSTFKLDIEEFLRHEEKQLLVFDTRHLGLGVLRMRQTLAKLEGDLSRRYVQDDNLMFVNWSQLLNFMSYSSNVYFSNLVVLDFESATLQERDVEVLEKLVKGLLSSSKTKKIVLMSSQKGIFKEFLRKLNDKEVFSEMDDSNCEQIIYIKSETENKFPNEHKSKECLKKPASSIEAAVIDAAAMGRLTEILEFIEDGADINLVDSNRDTALHKAAKNRHKDVVLALLQKGAKHQTNKWRETPLHLASANGHTDVMVALLESNVNVNIRGHNNKTPLHCAAENGHADAALTLLENGAYVNAKDYDKRTPLHRAARNVHNDVALTLLKYGADISARSDGKWTPLHYAASYEHNTLLIHTLIEHGSEVDCRESSNRTPLVVAALNGHMDAVETLIQKGANVNYCVEYIGRNSIHFVNKSKYNALLDFLEAKCVN